MTDLFDFSAAATRYAVMGNPVKHSKSPQIHSMFARQCGISMDYQAIQAQGFQDFRLFFDGVEQFQAAVFLQNHARMGEKSEHGCLHVERPGRPDKPLQNLAMANVHPIEGSDGNHTGPGILVFRKATDCYHGIKIIKKRIFSAAKPHG